MKKQLTKTELLEQIQSERQQLADCISSTDRAVRRSRLSREAVRTRVGLLDSNSAYASDGPGCQRVAAAQSWAAK
jgi:hypothetical protein